MAQRSNPFVAVQPRPAEDAGPELVDEILGERLLERGPSSPEVLSVDSSQLEATEWPRTSITQHLPLTVFGLHGGAGTSTLAHLLGDQALDAGQGWPIASGWTRPLPTLDVLAVARTHHTGLAAAEQFTQLWASGGLPESRLVGLVLVDDGPNLTDGQKRAVKRLLKKTPLGAHLPWMEQWRHSFPDPARLPGRLKRLLKAIHSH